MLILSQTVVISPRKVVLPPAKKPYQAELASGARRPRGPTLAFGNLFRLAGGPGLAGRTAGAPGADMIAPVLWRGCGGLRLLGPQELGSQSYCAGRPRLLSWLGAFFFLPAILPFPVGTFNPSSRQGEKTRRGGFAGHSTGVCGQTFGARRSAGRGPGTAAPDCAPGGWARGHSSCPEICLPSSLLQLYLWFVP